MPPIPFYICINHLFISFPSIFHKSTIIPFYKIIDSSNLLVPSLASDNLLQYNLSMLGSFNSMLDRLKSNKLISTMSDQYTKLKDKMLKKIIITQILPQLYHIDFPQQINIPQLTQHINHSPYQIWNISQYAYQDKFDSGIREKNQGGELMHLCFQFYSNLPFFEIIDASNRIKMFINANPKNKVYVHCQDSKMRSAVFLATFLFLTKSIEPHDISEAILFVNQKLNTQIEDHNGTQSKSYRNQHRLFKNLMNYDNNPTFINPQMLILQKMLINHAPQIIAQQQANSTQPQLKIIVQVRVGERITFKGVFANSVEGGSVSINFHDRGKGVTVGDDFLVIVKYAWGNKVFNVLRIQLNSNFVFQNFARVHQQDIDLSSHCICSQQNSVFIDFIFSTLPTRSKLARIQELQKLKQQQNQSTQKTKQTKQQNYDLLGHQTSTSVPQQNFALQCLQGLQLSPQIDDYQLNLKIQQVMKSITLKDEQAQLQKEQEEEEDFDDYLSKLQEQAEI